ncbi:MAG: glycosyltransferase family 2 protein [Candidatus Scalindua rubra]|uniref:Glycosyltransferase family 2 n=1 Tax=Candidatus Scalindua brodae TaxID=237368 RepID=A0A0B0EMT3_9BACT|nr:MAG: glycosyltransferase family 2 [Candidatus Scalindua brodae]MBZ0109879.1 glycosyltransferase family 2 protein [Candidatus Scalindua rubra]
MVDISFIIVNWNTRDILMDCLHSIYKTVTDIDVEVYVVDNNSTDGSQAAVKKGFPDVKLIENPANTGFAHANNQALRIMQGRFAVLLNSDAVLKEGAIDKLLAFMTSTHSAGIAGVQLLNEDGSRQNSIDNFPSIETEIFNKSILRLLFPGKYPSKNSSYQWPTEVDSVIGACMMVRKEAMDEVGVLDEDYFIFLEETDWCFRMYNKGWKVYHVPDAEVFHLSGHSKKKNPWRSQIEYYKSLYMFFRKNRTPVSYLTLRILKPWKISINLILNILGNLITLFQKEGLRNRLLKYYKLSVWHLLMCPDSMGIQKNYAKQKDS